MAVSPSEPKARILHVSTSLPSWVWVLAFLLIVLPLYVWLPSLGAFIQPSPDETAVAVVTREIATHGRAWLSEPLAVAFPWLHPRSWVSLGPRIVPIGFLGWPAFLSVWYRFGGLPILSWIGLLVVLSGFWPLFYLLSRFGKRAAWAGTLVAATFPPMILYANRAVFPNAPLVAGVIWSLWILEKLRTSGRHSERWYGIEGIITALVIAVRPIELLWIVPWWVCFGRGMRPTRRQGIYAILGAALVFLPILRLAWHTYGSWWHIGYWIQDNPSLNTNRVLSSPPLAHAAIPFLFPFGIHPHNVWWNVHGFLTGLMWPWTLLGLLAMSLWWKEAHKNFRLRITPAVCALWTGCVLMGFYGNGLYQDHVRLGAITMGNSFLRYLLPLAPLMGLAFAFFWSRLERRPRGELFAVLLLILLVGFGVDRAWVRDDEGIWFTRPELRRYAEVRAETQKFFVATDVIFSERSDKIFFPAFRAVSPLPSHTEIARLVQTQNIGAGLYIRPLSQADKDAWNRVGLEAQEVGASGRERLYRLVKRL